MFARILAAPLLCAALVQSAPLTARNELFARKLLGSSFGVPQDATFDYVVVGAGNAGLTVAARLAEDPSVSVAVIEAGSFYEIENGNLSQIPAYDTKWTGKDAGDVNRVDWGFVTTPQEVSCSKEILYRSCVLTVL